MAKVYSDRLVVSIDVGTTKMCVLIAQHVGNNQLEILGVGKAPSDGLKKGVVIDVAKTIHAIKVAVKEAELMADVKIESAAIGVSGGHIQSLTSQGMVPIKKGEVRTTDIEAALDAAKAIPLPEGMQILHVLPQYFVIDSHAKVQDPLGMYGIRLEVQAHIILGAIASVQNLVKCCEMAGIKVSDVILEQLASADAVLSEDERELGVAMLDIGGGTSDLAMYQNGSIRHTFVLPVAGNHFTNDIAIGLRTTLLDAERIKKEYGLATMKALNDDTIFEVNAVYGSEKKLVQQTELVAIIAPRAQELLALIHGEVIKRNLQSFMATGLVLTGGGSLLVGLQPLAQQIFDCPVRIGIPRLAHSMPESLENPIYATAYGLLVHMLKKSSHQSMDSLSGPMVNRMLLRMKSWVSDFF